MAVDISTTYLGLKLTSPFIAGASPLGDRLDTVRRLEDAGCSGIVLHSMFEEQVSLQQTGRIHQMDVLDARFSTVLSYYPKPEDYAFSPDQYLEHLAKAKAAVGIPIIASLNGTSPHEWLKFALNAERAGADAIELNVYDVVTDPDQSGASVEHWQRQLLKDLKHVLRVPIAIKLSPYYTAFANVAREFERAGADGLVLFNRFLQPDVDTAALAIVPKLTLSTNAELPARLRWLAVLRGIVTCSLAATGGVEGPADGIKALLAGADVVQLVSTILRHGPGYFHTMRGELERWMADLGFESLVQIRGRLSMAGTEQPSDFERAQYMKALSGWNLWLAYGAAPGKRGLPN